jgi:hypothetical protein
MKKLVFTASRVGRDAFAGMTAFSGNLTEWTDSVKVLKSEFTCIGEISFSHRLPLGDYHSRLGDSCRRLMIQ